MEWISVSDRLPEVGNWCLAFSDNQPEILFIDSHEPVIWIQHGDWLDKVTHWMPLPEPPNES